MFYNKHVKILFLFFILLFINNCAYCSVPKPDQYIEGLKLILRFYQLINQANSPAKSDYDSIFGPDSELEPYLEGMKCHKNGWSVDSDECIDALGDFEKTRSNDSILFKEIRENEYLASFFSLSKNDTFLKMDVSNDQNYNDQSLQKKFTVMNKCNGGIDTIIFYITIYESGAYIDEIKIDDISLPEIVGDNLEAKFFNKKALTIDDLKKKTKCSK